MNKKSNTSHAPNTERTWYNEKYFRFYQDGEKDPTFTYHDVNEITAAAKITAYWEACDMFENAAEYYPYLSALNPRDKQELAENYVSYCSNFEGEFSFDEEIDIKLAVETLQEGVKQQGFKYFNVHGLSHNALEEIAERIAEIDRQMESEKPHDVELENNTPATEKYSVFKSATDGYTSQSAAQEITYAWANYGYWRDQPITGGRDRLFEQIAYNYAAYRAQAGLPIGLKDIAMPKNAYDELATAVKNGEYKMFTTVPEVFPAAELLPEAGKYVNALDKRKAVFVPKSPGDSVVGDLGVIKPSKPGALISLQETREQAYACMEYANYRADQTVGASVDDKLLQAVAVNYTRFRVQSGFKLTQMSASPRSIKSAFLELTEAVNAGKYEMFSPEGLDLPAKDILKHTQAAIKISDQEISEALKRGVADAIDRYGMNVTNGMDLDI